MKTYRKAITAALAVAAGTYGGLLADGATNVPEVLIALGAGLVAGAAVYQVPNA